MKNEKLFICALDLEFLVSHHKPQQSWLRPAPPTLQALRALRFFPYFLLPHYSEIGGKSMCGTCKRQNTTAKMLSLIILLI